MSPKRRLLLVVALLSWVAPSNPEVLEKKKKKHHHHRRHHHSRHNLTEALNKTVNHTSGELHDHPHHGEALQVHPNASLQPRHVAKAAPATTRPSALPAEAPA